MKRINFRKYLRIILGIFLIAFSFNMFFRTNNLVVEDTMGIALIYNESFNFNIELSVLILNVIILLFGFIIIGFKDCSTSILSSLLMPLFIYLTKDISVYADISGVETIVQAIFGGLFTAYGYSILFENGYTAGGTDLINKIVARVFKIPYEVSMMIFDGLIIIAGGLIFGMESMIYSILSFALIILIGNQKIEGNCNNKVFYINTTKSKAIKKYILENWKSDITVIDAEKGYSTVKSKVLLCVVDSGSYYKIKEGILEIDPKAFITITDSFIAINKNKQITSTIKE